MADSLWLSILEDADGALLLHEFYGPYMYFDGLPEATPRIITIIRGRYDQTRGIPRRGRQIHLWRLAMAERQELVLVADCGMHLLQNWPMVQNDSGRIPGNVRQLRVNSSGCVHDVTHGLYSQLIAPLSSVVVFFEPEHGSLKSIMRDLAKWVTQAPPGERAYARPRVVIVARDASNGPAMPAEKRLAVEIVNQDVTHTFGTAMAAWQNVFEGIRLWEHSGSLSEQLLAEALGCHPWTGWKAALVKRLLRGACVQFAETGKTCNLIRASRVGPVSNSLPAQLEKLFARRRLSSVDLRCRFAASALTIDGCSSFISGVPPQAVFREFYADTIKQIQSRTKVRDLAVKIDENFAKLAARVASGVSLSRSHRSSLRKCQSLWRGVSIDGPCPSCLVNPLVTNYLTCGHGLCYSCIRLLGSSAGRSQVLRLPECPLCGEANCAPVRLNHPTAGLRVLNISGGLADTSQIGCLLRSLHTELPGRLDQHFDLVVGSGVGVFFALMVFCNQVPPEDCESLSVKLRYVKVNRKRFKFSRHVKFLRGELLHSAAKIFVRHGSTLMEGSGSHSTLVRTSQSEVDHLAGLWPGSKIDITVDCAGGDEEYIMIPVMADKLVASLFYVELPRVVRFYTNSPINVSLNIRCRLLPGPALMDLMSKIREKKIRVYYNGDEPQQNGEFCPPAVWGDLLHGREFTRSLQVRAASLASFINVRMDGLVTGGWRDVSNCPYRLECLVDSLGESAPVEVRPAGGYVEKVKLMESMLRRFVRP